MPLRLLLDGLEKYQDMKLLPEFFELVVIVIGPNQRRARASIERSLAGGEKGLLTEGVVRVCNENQGALLILVRTGHHVARGDAGGTTGVGDTAAKTDGKAGGFEGSSGGAVGGLGGNPGAHGRELVGCPSCREREQTVDVGDGRHTGGAVAVTVATAVTGP